MIDTGPETNKRQAESPHGADLLEILLELIDKVSSIRAGKTFTPTDYAEPALAALQTVMLDVIGVDEVEPATPYGAILAVQKRNALRDKQRQALSLKLGGQK